MLSTSYQCQNLRYGLSCTNESQKVVTVCLRNIFCLRKCAHLQRDKKHSRSPVDAGFEYDQVRAAQNFQKSRGLSQNCRCQKGDMKQVSN